VNIRIVFLVGPLLVILALAPPGQAELDFSVIQRQAATDSVMRALADQLPTAGTTLISEVIPSDSYFVGVSANRVAVSTRFLREASRNALAAAVARYLLPDPVYLAITLSRAGFDGPGGLAELYNRLAGLISLEAQNRANVETAYRTYQAELMQNSFNVWSREGYHRIYLARINGARARYEQSLQVYRAFQAEMARFYAMSPVPAGLVQAVTEITAVLNGREFIEISPWGPRIRAALQVYDRSKSE
jgi:hypothetical protein